MMSHFIPHRVPLALRVIIFREIENNNKTLP
jgi:hypothetical protein